MEKWICGSHLKKKKKKKSNKPLDQTENDGERTGEGDIFLNFILLVFFLRFTETCLSDFVGINTKSALCNEGYA